MRSPSKDFSVKSPGLLGFSISEKVSALSLFWNEWSLLPVESGFLTGTWGFGSLSPSLLADKSFWEKRWFLRWISFWIICSKSCFLCS